MRLCCFVLCLVVVSFGRAEAQPGELTGFSFLRLEPSARAAALGGSYAAVYGDGRHYEGLASFGVGLRFLSWGSFDRADETGERLGTFGASDVALTLGAARTYGERLRYGANVHVVYSSLDAYNASALAADVGVLYHVAERNLTFSASVNNLGVTLSSLGTTRDELPVDLRLSFSKRLTHLPLLITVMGYNLHDPGNTPDDATAVDNVLYHLALGGEFQFSEAFRLRFGYNHRRHEELKLKSRLDLAGLGLGVGLRISRVRIDYAFNSWSSLGGLHQFTLRTRL